MTDKKEKTLQEKANEFVAEYQKLCKKHGLQLNSIPIYKARDDGTWSTVLQTSVEQLPKQQE